MKKTIEQFERERNLVVKDLGDFKPGDSCTEEQFNGLATLGNIIGIDHEGRTDWLRSNGYEVTRDNLIDTELEPRKRRRKG